jgi:methyltransferase-like protein
MHKLDYDLGEERLVSLQNVTHNTYASNFQELYILQSLSSVPV